MTTLNNTELEWIQDKIDSEYADIEKAEQRITNLLAKKHEIMAKQLVEKLKVEVFA